MTLVRQEGTISMHMSPVRWTHGHLFICTGCKTKFHPAETTWQDPKVFFCASPEDHLKECVVCPGCNAYRPRVMTVTLWKVTGDFLDSAYLDYNSCIDQVSFRWSGTCV